MCLKGMGYNLEVIAPDSENTMIKPHVIEHLKKKYKKVITLFDNDEAGKKAIDTYANAYKIDGFTLTICKDISDAMKEHGFDKVHKHLKPLLKTTLNK
jgi:DNA primase